jgi:cytochrome c556
LPAPPPCRRPLHTLAVTWKEKDKFDAAANKMQEEVVKLNAAAKSGNVDQLKSAVGTVGRACKACHDDFSTL